MPDATAPNPNTTTATPINPPEKEWTLMFYFASANPLAPSVISQLKALKNAGFHPQANVITYFRPQTRGTPTHIFDVNLVNKLKNHGKPKVGFTANDPFVRTLMEDKLWGDQRDREGTFIRDRIKQLLRDKHQVEYNPPLPPPNMSLTPVAAPADPSIRKLGPTPSNRSDGPKESLETFLKFCREEYPARHYMLFLVGHGLVVGNDMFLFDERAETHSLSLKGLGDVLRAFKIQIREAELELVSFHSCSLSGLEVAYELQSEVNGQLRGVANFMLASQGPAFVGSWPYREILLRIFNDVEDLENKKTSVKAMLTKIFYYVLHNSADFLLAGYSFDLCFSDLNRVSAVRDPIRRLSDTLIEGLAQPPIRDLILMSHWRSLSYWEESYTDFYDFCFCLGDACREFAPRAGDLGDLVARVGADCSAVMDQLNKGVLGDDDRLIIRAEFAGPEYQYAHGLSVYFPWSKPSIDSKVMEKYNQYNFKETGWSTFLDAYFDATIRLPRQSEPDPKALKGPQTTDEDRLHEDMASLCYNSEGPLSGTLGDDDPPPPPIKPNPRDRTGDECTCASIKNYPHDTRPRQQRKEQAFDQTLPLSGTFFEQF